MRSFQSQRSEKKRPPCQIPLAQDRTSEGKRSPSGKSCASAASVVEQRCERTGDTPRTMSVCLPADSAVRRQVHGLSETLSATPLGSRTWDRGQCCALAGTLEPQCWGGCPGLLPASHAAPGAVPTNIAQRFDTSDTEAWFSLRFFQPRRSHYSMRHVQISQYQQDLTNRIWLKRLLSQEPQLLLPHCRVWAGG